MIVCDSEYLLLYLSISITICFDLIRFFFTVDENKYRIYHCLNSSMMDYYSMTDSMVMKKSA